MLVGGAAGERGRQRDVLERRQRRDQVVGLEHEADAVAANLRELLLGERADLQVAQEHLPARQAVEAGDAVQQRGLARAGRAHDRGVLRTREVDLDLVECAHSGVARSVDLRRGDRAGGEGRGGGDCGRHETLLSARPAPR